MKETIVGVLAVIGGIWCFCIVMGAILRLFGVG